MHKLYRNISLILLIAICLSIATDAWYRSVYKIEYKWPQNIWIRPEIEEKYELIKLGNSHSDDGIVFDQFKSKSLSLSSVAQSFEYDLLTLKMYARQIEEGAVIIINVSPISFSQKKPSKEDSLQYKYYDGRLSPFLIPDLKVGDYLQSQIVPFTRAVFLWREAHAKKVKEQAMETFAQNWKTSAKKADEVSVNTNDMNQKTDNAKSNVETNTFVLDTDTPASTLASNQQLQNPEISIPYESQERLSDSVRFMFDKWYRTKDFGTQYFAANSKDLETLIRYCLRHKWRPVLITIPISQALLNGLGTDYMQKYVYNPLKATDTQGVEYIDFSKNSEFNKNGYFFSNSDHLNKNGALFLSDLLHQKLIEKGYLPKEEVRH